MLVPQLFVDSLAPLSMVNLHEAYPTLDQPSCQQALLAEDFRSRVIQAVEASSGPGLDGKVESFGCCRLHAAGQLPGGDLGVEMVVLGALPAMQLVQFAQGDVLDLLPARGRV